MFTIHFYCESTVLVPYNMLIALLVFHIIFIYITYVYAYNTDVVQFKYTQIRCVKNMIKYTNQEENV